MPELLFTAAIIMLTSTSLLLFFSIFRFSEQSSPGEGGVFVNSILRRDECVNRRFADIILKSQNSFFLLHRIKIHNFFFVNKVTVAFLIKSLPPSPVSLYIYVKELCHEINIC